MNNILNYKFLILMISVQVVCMGVALASVGQNDPEKDSLFIPSFTYEYVPDATYEQIADRIKRIDTEIPLIFNTRVKSFVDYFTVRDREYTKMVIRRSTYYFPIFEKILAEYNMPDELKYLAIVESGLKASARSWASAVGLWQFVYYTGRSYGLNSDAYIDDRMDPVRSTEAAAKYLKSLYGMFGDWELALAAYNCGPGNVRKAIRRSGNKKNFWDIYAYLPRETRGYLPQFVAIAYAFNYQEEHNFFMDDFEYLYPISSDTIMVKSFLNLNTLAEMLDVCSEEMDLLNPSIKHKVVPESSKYLSVRIPSDKLVFFQENRSTILDSASRAGKKELELLAGNTGNGTYGREKVVHRVRSGDVLGKIAARYHVRVSDIKNWNHLRSNTIHVGQKLDIWPTSTSYVASSKPQQSATKQNVVENGTKYYIVQPGDTLWDISKAFNNMSIDRLKELNNLKSNKIQPGQKLVIG